MPRSCRSKNLLLQHFFSELQRGDIFPHVFLCADKLRRARALFGHCTIVDIVFKECRPSPVGTAAVADALASSTLRVIRHMTHDEKSVLARSGAVDSRGCKVAHISFFGHALIEVGKL